MCDEIKTNLFSDPEVSTSVNESPANYNKFKLSAISWSEFQDSVHIVSVTNLDSIASSVAKGNQFKWYDKHTRQFIKCAFEYQDRVWKDYLCEALACRIADQLGIATAMTRACYIEDNGRYTLGSISENFLQEDEQFISFYRMLNRTQLDSLGSFFRRASVADRIQWTVNVYGENFGLDASKYIFDMICLDFLMGNEDRHLNNFGAVWSTQGWKLPPLFDNGLAMFEHASRYIGAPLQVCIRKMLGRPFCSDLRKTFKEACRVLAWRSHLNTDFLDLSGCVFPSAKSVRYLEYAADEIGLRLEGEVQVLHD